MKKYFLLLLLTLNICPSSEIIRVLKQTSEMIGKVKPGTSTAPSTVASKESLKKEIKRHTDRNIGSKLSNDVDRIAAEHYYDGARDYAGLSAHQRAEETARLLREQCLNHSEAIAAIDTAINDLKGRYATREELASLQEKLQEKLQVLKENMPSVEKIASIETEINRLWIESNRNIKDLRTIVNNSNPFRAMANYSMDLISKILLHDNFNDLSNQRLYILLLIAGVFILADQYGIDAVVPLFKGVPGFNKLNEHKVVLHWMCRATYFTVGLAGAYKIKRLVALSSVTKLKGFF